MKNEGIRIARPCSFYSLNRKLKIIVVKLDHLGDFIVAIPALTRLREKFRGADIDIIVGEWNAHLADRLKYFRNIYTYNYLRHAMEGGDRSAEEQEEKLLSELESFDIAIDLRRHADTRFLLAKIRASLKVGYKSFGTHDSDLDVCMHTQLEESGKVKDSDRCHMASQLIRLVDDIPCGSIDLPRLCNLNPVGTQIAIFPKAGNEAREWPVKYAVELCQEAIREKMADALNVYLPKSQSQLSAIFTRIPSVLVHTGLSMGDLIDSLVKNVLTISNNSFGAHISSYLGIATIAIYSGHEFVSQWGPAFGNTTVIYSKVSCAPCHKRLERDCPHDNVCIKQITPDHVIGLMREELRNAKERDAPFATRRYFLS